MNQVVAEFHKGETMPVGRLGKAYLKWVGALTDEDRDAAWDEYIAVRDGITVDQAMRMRLLNLALDDEESDEPPMLN